MSQNSENEEIWISFCQKIILVILQHDTHLGTGTENPVRKTSIQDAPVLAQKLCTWSSVLDVLKSCQCMALDDLLSLVQHFSSGFSQWFFHCPQWVGFFRSTWDVPQCDWELNKALGARKEKN